MKQMPWPMMLRMLWGEVIYFCDQKLIWKHIYILFREWECVCVCVHTRVSEVLDRSYVNNFFVAAECNFKAYA